MEVEEMHNRGLQVAVTIVKAELRSVYFYIEGKAWWFSFWSGSLARSYLLGQLIQGENQGCRR